MTCLQWLLRQALLLLSRTLLLLLASHILLHCVDDLAHYWLKHFSKLRCFVVIEFTVNERLWHTWLQVAHPAGYLWSSHYPCRPVFRLLVYELLACSSCHDWQLLSIWNEHLCYSQDDLVKRFSHVYLLLLCIAYLNFKRHIVQPSPWHSLELLLLRSIALGFCFVVVIPSIFMAPFWVVLAVFSS